MRDLDRPESEQPCALCGEPIGDDDPHFTSQGTAMVHGRCCPECHVPELTNEQLAAELEAWADDCFDISRAQLLEAARRLRA